MIVLRLCSNSENRHVFTPWVQERWKPSLDTRVCKVCKHWEKRPHMEGAEMFPTWLLANRRGEE